MNQEKIKNIAYANARRIINEQNLDVDINDLAYSLLPKIEEAEEMRLQEKIEDVNNLFQKEIEKKKNKKDYKGIKKCDIKFHSKFEEEMKLESATFKALAKKSESSDIPLEVIGEVFDRGYDMWTEDVNISQDQYAFARVNSYINKGKTYFNEDSDLHEESELIHHGAILTRTNKEIRNSSGGYTTEFKHIKWSKKNEIHPNLKSISGAGAGYAHPNAKHEHIHSHPDIIKHKKQGWKVETYHVGTKKKPIIDMMNNHAMKNFNDGKYNLVEDLDLNELSKETLRSYDNAAYKDKTKTFINKGVSGISRMNKRTKGMALASKKLAREELDINEMDSQAEKIRKLNRNFRDRKRQSDKRLELNRKAASQNKDSLNELSKNTLRDYIDKAETDKYGNPMKQHSLESGKYDSEGSRRIKKRTFGIEKASNALRKKSMSEELGKENKIGLPGLVRKLQKLTPGQDCADINPKDPSDLKETAKSYDRKAIVVPAHTDAYGNIIPAKTHWRRSSRKIIDSGNLSDGQ